MSTDSKEEQTVRFAPILYFDVVADAIAFYEKAFGARELRRWSNDGSVHVAEMKIRDDYFHVFKKILPCISKTIHN